MEVKEQLLDDVKSEVTESDDAADIEPGLVLVKEEIDGGGVAATDPYILAEQVGCSESKLAN